MLVLDTNGNMNTRSKTNQGSMRWTYQVSIICNTRNEKLSIAGPGELASGILGTEGLPVKVGPGLPFSQSSRDAGRCMSPHASLVHVPTKKVSSTTSFLPQAATLRSIKSKKRSEAIPTSSQSVKLGHQSLLRFLIRDLS